MLGTYALSAGYYEAYYGQAQKVRTVIARRARRRLPRLRRARLADLADGGLQARREGREPARDVPRRRAHDPVEHGRPAGALDPVRPVRGSPRRLPADRAAVLREHALPRRPRAGAGDRLRLRPQGGCSELGAGHRPRDPHPPEDADEDVLPLRGRLPRAREHAHLPGLPRTRARCRCPTRRRSSGRSSSGSRSTARSPSTRSSTGRTTSIRTFRRATRSPSTTSPCA